MINIVWYLTTVKYIDRRKSSVATQQLIARRIHRLVENKEDRVTNSERIFHDYNKDLDAMHTDYLADGYIVAKLSDCNGDRYSKDGTVKHGGIRIKGDVDEG